MERQIGVKSACEFQNKIEDKIRLDLDGTRVVYGNILSTHVGAVLCYLWLSWTGLVLRSRLGIGRGGIQKCGGPYGCVRRVRDFFFPALRRKQESNFIVNAATTDINSTHLITANLIRTFLIRVSNTWRFACYLVRT